jgi:uncharacterized protein YjiS (DUF1127 family)
MSATYGAIGSGQTAASTRRILGFFKSYWGSFQERRKRQRLRATLCDLSDRELMDIGTTRGEIDYEPTCRSARHTICRMNVRCPAMVEGWNWTRPVAALPRGRHQYGSEGGIAERRENLWRPCDLVHLLYACRCRRRGVHGDDQTWSSIMPIMFDVLYREFCRARLAEMRKQLLLWPGTPVVPERNCEAGHPDDAADRGIGLGSSQEWDRSTERSHS